MPVIVDFARKQGLTASATPPATRPNARHVMLIETMDHLDRLQTAQIVDPRPPPIHIWLISRSLSSFSLAYLVEPRLLS